MTHSQKNALAWGLMIGLIVLSAAVSSKPSLDTALAIWALSMAWVAALALMGAVYMLPTIVAWFRGNKNILAIAVLNVALGWTLLGWVAALVWAVIEQERGAR